MPNEPSNPLRTHVAVAIAAATTTLAIGVTMAALGGYLHATPNDSSPSAPANVVPPHAAPASNSDPRVVLVPIERVEPVAAPAFAEDPGLDESSQLASDTPYFDDDHERHEHAHERRGRRTEDEDDD